MERTLNKSTKVGLFALATMVILFGLFHERLIRVYRAMNLFERDRIVSNFRSMETMFEAVPVRRGGDDSSLEGEPADLPPTYEFDGETKDLVRFLDDTWTTGLVVLREDKIVFEEYYRGNSATSKTISWSVAKSFVSAMIGIAVAEGDIADIHQPVTDFVPILTSTGYDGVSIKDVLQMSSGVRFNEDYGDFFSDINRLGRAIAFGTPVEDIVLRLKRERTPGTYLHYVSMDTQVLGMVLRAATGQTVTSYLEKKIWQKIGMESDAYLLVDSKGMEMVFGCLIAVLRDYARLGMLYLNEGAWNGEQIIPSGWVQTSVTADVPHLRPGCRPTSDSVLGYGFQWWIPPEPEGDFLAIGIYNQFIYVHPGHRVVIAKSSAYPDYNLDGNEKELESIAVFRAIAEDLTRQASVLQP